MISAYRLHQISSQHLKVPPCFTGKMLKITKIIVVLRLAEAHQADEEKGELREISLLTVDISDLLCSLARNDLKLHHSPGGPAHHAGVVPGVGVGGARDVEARLSTRNQEISSYTATDKRPSDRQSRLYISNSKWESKVLRQNTSKTITLFLLFQCHNSASDCLSSKLYTQAVRPQYFPPYILA